MKKTFDPGDLVVYKNKGVCVITGVEKKKFSSMEETEYYVISSVSDKRYKGYVPTGTAEQLIRPLPSKEQIGDIIKDSLRMDADYIEDRKKRSDHYNAAVRRDDERELLCLYRMLDGRKAADMKMPASDVNMMAYIERQINEIFSAGLGIEKENVGEYIRKTAEEG